LKAKILLIGYGTEPTLRHVCQQAARLRVDYDFLDLIAVRDAPRIRVEQTSDDLVIEMASRQFRFSCFHSFYNRCDYVDLGQPLRNLAVSRIFASVSAWLEFAGALVVNRPSAGAPNANKFLHAAELQHYGFETPEQIIVGNRLCAESALDAGGAWINKSCSSSRSIATVLDPELWERLHLLTNCPSLFQRRIVGPDVRVHVVGGQLFAEKIVSQSIDYRFHRGDTPNAYSDCDVPADICRLCLAYCEMRGLLLAGFDFKINDYDGNWYALEANPRPGFEAFDRRQGYQISKALLSLLSDGVTKAESGKHQSSFASGSNDAFISESRRPPIRIL
jgi:hypothetical protein